MPSQKFRPIAFVLDTGSLFVPAPLLIRPEDLTRTEPSRASVHQTLSSGSPTGWVDNFGPALPTITISGHTGWRGPAGLSFLDGEIQFQFLRQVVFPQYHDAKQRAIDAGRDPSEVKLILVDTLDLFIYEVVPLSFTLRRSKSRPLLMMYNIQLTAVSNEIG